MDFQDRLQKLDTRRNPHPTLLESMYGEPYAQTNFSKSIKYALGAMAPVKSEYTQKSKDEGFRVASTLQSLLIQEGLGISYELQGSVALDIHIKGVSDVDVLVLHPYLTTETPEIDPLRYSSPNNAKPMIEAMRVYRELCEDKLLSRYYAADVDITGAKSISLSGGSLERKVDIVPSHWRDTIKYQMSNNIRDREVRIYDKSIDATVGNMPFKHIGVISDRDLKYNGNLRKVCRLLRTLQADVSDDLKDKISSIKGYDMASISYHMDNNLSTPLYFDLSLVDAARNFLLDLIINKDFRNSLITPDESRKVFDDNSKLDALIVLTNEVVKLSDSIFEDLKPANIDQYSSQVLRSANVAY